MSKALKILITGSNGQLGQKLVSHCIAHEISFLATANSENKFSLCPDENFTVMDVTNAQQVKEIVLSFSPTHIINSAAMTNVDACEEEVGKCYAINTDSVQYLLENAIQVKAHLIQISTDFIFDGEKRLYREEDPANPLGEYGKSKWEAEKLLRASKYPLITILRTSVLFGLGENLNKSNIFSWALEQLRAEKSINIVDDQYRTPTLVDDLANACFLVVNSGKTGVFNIAGEELASMYYFIRQVAQYLRVDEGLVQAISTKTLNQRAPRPQSSGLDIMKAKMELNYQPTSFIESLRKIDTHI